MVLVRGAALGGLAGLALALVGMLLTVVAMAVDGGSSTQYPWIFAFFIFAAPALVAAGAGVVAAGALVADHARVTRPVASARRRGATVAAGLAALLSLLTAGAVGLLGALLAATVVAAVGFGVTFLAMPRVLGAAPPGTTAAPGTTEQATTVEPAGTGRPRPRWQRPLMIGLVALVAFWVGAALGGSMIEALDLGRDAASAGALVVALLSAAAGGAVAHRTLA